MKKNIISIILMALILGIPSGVYAQQKTGQKINLNADSIMKASAIYPKLKPILDDPKLMEAYMRLIRVMQNKNKQTDSK